MTLGEYIIQYRESHHLSQRAFAEKCQLSNGYISMLERGVNPNTKKPIVPQISQLRKIAVGMGISLSDLFLAIDDLEVQLNQQAPPLSADDQSLLDAYHRAPQETKDIVDVALRPYRQPQIEEKAI